MVELLFMRKKKYDLTKLPQSLNKKIDFKILYDGRYPSEKAAALFVSEQAINFSKNGYEAEIITSKRKTLWENQKYNDKEFYLSNHTSIGPMFSPKTKTILILNQIRYGLNVRKYLTFSAKNNKRICIICNNIFPLIVQNRKNYLVFEIHDDVPKLLRFKFFRSRISLFICTNSFKFNQLNPNDQKKSLLLRNPTNVTFNDDLEDPARSREFLISFFKAPADSKIILYTGSFGVEKNPKLLFEIINLLPKFSFCFLGPGISQAMSKQSILKKPNNLFFSDSVDIATVKRLQKGADILLLTENQENAISALYTSPMKLIEYIDARKVIVAPDLPAIREFLPLKGLYLYKPESVQHLRNLIIGLPAGQTTVMRSDQELEKFSWDFRISELVKKIND